MTEPTYPTYITSKQISIKIIDLLKDFLSDEINEKGNYHLRGVVPRFSDMELMALSSTAKCLSIDSENYMFSIIASLQVIRDI